MNWIEQGDAVFAVLQVGDPLHESLESLATAAGLGSFSVTGIGAVDEVELAYYRLDEKRYDVRPLDGIYELVSLTGNVTQRDGKPLAHLHACLGGPDLATVGGHLVSARCAITVEARISPLPVSLNRGDVDSTCGLRLIELPRSSGTET